MTKFWPLFIILLVPKSILCDNYNYNYQQAFATPRLVPQDVYSEQICNDGQCLPDANIQFLENGASYDYHENYQEHHQQSYPQPNCVYGRCSSEPKIDERIGYPTSPARLNCTVDQLIREYENTQRQRICYATNNIPPLSNDIIAPEGEYSHVAAVGFAREDGFYDYLCSGTLVDPKFVITSAYCLYTDDRRPSIVRVGGAPLYSVLSKHQPIEIVKTYVHPGYDPNGIFDDIAVLQLSRNAEQKPNCLFVANFTVYRRATLVGYGERDQVLPLHKNLNKVNIDLFAKHICSRFIPPRNSLTCAGDISGLRNDCPNDIGSPLLIIRLIEKQLVPFVYALSSSAPTCKDGMPALFTLIHPYVEWINSIIRSNGGSNTTATGRCLVTCFRADTTQRVYPDTKPLKFEK